LPPLTGCLPVVDDDLVVGRVEPRDEVSLAQSITFLDRQFLHRSVYPERQIGTLCRLYAGRETACPGGVHTGDHYRFHGSRHGLGRRWRLLAASAQRRGGYKAAGNNCFPLHLLDPRVR